MNVQSRSCCSHLIAEAFVAAQNTSIPFFEKIPERVFSALKYCHYADVASAVMSMGLVVAMMREKKLTAAGVMQSFCDLSGLPPTDEYFFASPTTVLPMTQVPSSASGARIFPMLLFAMEYYPNDCRLLCENIIVQTLSTHNYYSALLANFIYIDTAHALITGTIPCEGAIQYSLDFLSRIRIYDHLLPSLDDLNEAINLVAPFEGCYLQGAWQPAISFFKDNLGEIDKIPYPKEDERRAVTERAHTTLFATLFCLKWSSEDFFAKPMWSSESGVSRIIKRVGSFTGNVGGLLAQVLPVAVFTMQRHSTKVLQGPHEMEDGWESLAEIKRRINMALFPKIPSKL